MRIVQAYLRTGNHGKVWQTSAKLHGGHEPWHPMPHCNPTQAGRIFRAPYKHLWHTMVRLLRHESHTWPRTGEARHDGLWIVLWAKVFEGSFCHLPAGPLLPCTGKKRQIGKSNIIKKQAQNHLHNRWWIILNEIVLKWVNLVYFNYINYHIW